MKILNIHDDNSRFDYCFTNRTILLVVNNWKTENKYGIIRITSHINDVQKILKTNSKEEVKIWMDLQGMKIGEKFVFVEDIDENKSNIVFEGFVLNKEK